MDYIAISWYNRYIEGGDYQKIRHKKRSYFQRWQQKSKIIQKRIYNIEENGGKPQNIYTYLL